MGKLELVIESDHVSIYSPKYDGETQTEFEKFMSDNGNLENPQLKKDFDAIIAAIKKIIDDCGARENLFRPEGNNIKAIPLCKPHYFCDCQIGNLFVGSTWIYTKYD